MRTARTCPCIGPIGVYLSHQLFQTFLGIILGLGLDLLEGLGVSIVDDTGIADEASGGVSRSYIWRADDSQHRNNADAAKETIERYHLVRQRSYRHALYRQFR